LPRTRYPWVNSYHGPWDSSYFNEPYRDMERVQKLHGADMKQYVQQNWLNESYYFKKVPNSDKLDLSKKS
jgi:hypothetical protein